MLLSLINLVVLRYFHDIAFFLVRNIYIYIYSVSGPDFADVYSNNNGFSPPMVPADTVAYLHKVSEYARRKGMSVGIKDCVVSHRYTY
jgi:hypothetical protein